MRVKAPRPNSQPQAPAEPRPLHRTTPLAASLTTVTGYPSKLVIYQLRASRFWWVRYYAHGKIARKSTKAEQKAPALAFAKLFYEDCLLRARQGLAQRSNTSFAACARSAMAEQAAQLKRGEITPITHSNAQYRLRKLVLPFFSHHEVSAMDYELLQQFLVHMGQRNPPLGLSTMAAYLKLVRKVLLHAQRTKLLAQLPQFPRVGARDQPRDHFNVGEYLQLWRAARCMAGQVWELRKVVIEGSVQTQYALAGQGRAGHLVRRVVIHPDLAPLIQFMVNGFMRPTDIKWLQHKHVEVVRNAHSYLRLRLPTSKRHSDPIVTMPTAVKVYARMLQRAKAAGHEITGQHSVFGAHYASRDLAMKEFQRQFDVLMQLTGLRQGVNGAARTLYSLRHTCIMYRLMYGQRMDVITLARNARTSPDMIDRFYAAQLTGEHNVDLLHGRRGRMRG